MLGLVAFRCARQTSSAQVVVSLVQLFAPLALGFDVGCITEKWFRGSCEETSERFVDAELEDLDDPGLTQPTRPRETSLEKKK